MLTLSTLDAELLHSLFDLVIVGCGVLDKHQYGVALDLSRGCLGGWGP